MEALTVVGLDPSLTATGLASSSGWTRTIGYTDKKNPITKIPHGLRRTAMRNVRDEILLAVGHPRLVVMETAALSRSAGGAHERGWLWWALYDALSDDGVPIGLMDPRQRAQYACGKGSGDKGAVIDAVARRWPQFETAGNDNRADAVALMAAGLDWLGQPLTVVPQVNRVAIERAVWPDIPEVTA
jgi:crossover junction endodeoxyribonuclease RuvC